MKVPTAVLKWRERDHLREQRECQAKERIFTATNA